MDFLCFQLVGMICSFVSVDDLLDVRLINKIFYREATRGLRCRHKPITFCLATQSELKSFFECMRARFEPDLNPFPFSSFRWSLNSERLKIFLKAIGEHIRQFELFQEPSYDSRGSRFRGLPQVSDHVKHNLEYTFLYARNIENLKVSTTFSLHLDIREMALLPSSFPRLRSIHIFFLTDRWSLLHLSPSTGLLRPPSQDSVPLLLFLVSRADNLDRVQVPTIFDLSPRYTISATRVIHERYHGRRLPTLSLYKSSIVQLCTLHQTLPTLRELSGTS
jgi:hypothetical protein